MCNLFIGLFNLAKYAKQTWQSSSNFGSAESKVAVDGKEDTHMSKGSCTHTKDDYHPWWAVDLGAVFNIVRVGILNRDSYVCE